MLFSAAFSISYTVRAATDTAVKASISTPVWPEVLTVAVIRTPGRSSSTTRSTETLVIGSGWHSGIRSAVFLAAMIPARRAMPRTSPFLAVPAATSASVWARMRTHPSATATRSVTGLPDTSTMWAWPCPSKCVSSAIARPFPMNRIGQDGAGGRRDIRLPHQAFADQETARPGAGHRGQVVGREQTRFRDHHPVVRHACGKLARGIQRGDEGVQIAVVDPQKR